MNAFFRNIILFIKGKKQIQYLFCTDISDVCFSVLKLRDNMYFENSNDVFINEKLLIKYNHLVHLQKFA